MKRGSVLLWIFTFAIPAGICQETRPVPALPFYDWKACPFEGCSYREWTAGKPVVAYDTWKEGRKIIAHVVTGEVVTGLNGVVITFKPGVIRMDRDVQTTDLKRGDAILTYAFRGEGFSAVSFKGKYYPEFDISFTKWPDGTGCGNEHCAATYIDPGRKEWWAAVKLKSGKTAWVEVDHAGIEGVDMLH